MLPRSVMTLQGELLELKELRLLLLLLLLQLQRMMKMRRMKLVVAGERRSHWPALE